MYLFCWYCIIICTYIKFALPSTQYPLSDTRYPLPVFRYPRFPPGKQYAFTYLWQDSFATNNFTLTNERSLMIRPKLPRTSSLITQFNPLPRENSPLDEQKRSSKSNDTVAKGLKCLLWEKASCTERHLLLSITTYRHLYLFLFFFSYPLFNDGRWIEQTNSLNKRWVCVFSIVERWLSVKPRLIVEISFPFLMLYFLTDQTFLQWPIKTEHFAPFAIKTQFCYQNRTESSKKDKTFVKRDDI